MFVRIPRDLEQRQLNQVEEVILNFTIGGEILGVLGGRQRRIIHPAITKLRLELDELREVRDELRLPGAPELHGSEDEAAGNREGAKRLKNDLDQLKGRRDRKSVV